MLLETFFHIAEKQSSLDVHQHLSENGAHLCCGILFSYKSGICRKTYGTQKHFQRGKSDPEKQVSNIPHNMNILPCNC